MKKKTESREREREIKKYKQRSQDYRSEQWLLNG